MKELQLEQVQQISGAGMFDAPMISIGGEIGSFLVGQVGSQLGLGDSGKSIGEAIGKSLGESFVTIGLQVNKALISAIFSSSGLGGSS